MKNKKIVVYKEKTNSVFIKTVTIKYFFPKVSEFISLFNSVGWVRSIKRVKENKNSTVFAGSLYVDNCIVGMGRIVGDG